MTKITHVTMTFALSLDNRMLHIDEVSNGASCACICPKCSDAVIAKNGGAERIHHFAHLNTSNCTGGAETALHLAAKQIIYDNKVIMLPDETMYKRTICEKQMSFDHVELEYAIEVGSDREIIVDCYCLNLGSPFIIEIAVYHFIDKTKEKIIETIGIPAVEIDISDQIDNLFTWEKLKYEILFNRSNRRWLGNAESEIGVAPEQLQTSNSLTTVPRRNEWRFAHGKTWIWVREMPFGNISVYHKYDDNVRRVIEPLCRTRGYWNSQYRNWIIFDRFKNELIGLFSCMLKPIA